MPENPKMQSYEKSDQVTYGKNKTMSCNFRQLEVELKNIHIKTTKTYIDPVCSYTTPFFVGIAILISFLIWHALCFRM
jgi:hypothetical protein